MKRVFGAAARRHISTDELSAYLDDQVTAAARARIESHLRTCETCQRELSSLRHTVALLQALPRVPVPRAFTLSEAQVGLAGPASSPRWLGGALRGMGVAAAIVLVAVVAVSVIRISMPTRPSTIARVAPTVAAQPAMERPAEMAKEAPAPAAAMALPTEASRVEEAGAADQAKPEAETLTVPALPPGTPAQEESVPPAPAPPQEAPSRAIAPAENQAEQIAPPVEGPVALAEAPLAADEAPAALAAEPAEAVAKASAEQPAMAMGRGGGGEPGPAGPGSFTSEPPPPPAAITDILSPEDGVAYVAEGGLWAIDGSGDEPRLLAPAPDGAMPAISPGRQWVSYRVSTAHSTELWVARWDGEQVRLLLTDQDLPEEDQGEDFEGRRIQDVRWIPDTNRLSMITMAFPGKAASAPRFDLWMVDVPSAALRHVLELQSADFPFYAPDGERFARLAFGEEQGSGGKLIAFNADGTEPRELLRFPDLDPDARYRVKAHWLSGDDGLLVAAPAVGPDADGPRMAIYRIGPDGQPKRTAQVEALDLFWSPDGKRLAYLSPAQDQPGVMDLMLASGEGKNPTRYTSLQMGNLLSWAPDGRHFLYISAGQVYLGGVQETPRAVSSLASILDPRWLTSERIIYLMNQGEQRVLASRDLAGRAVSLLSLPKYVSYDVTRP